MKNSKTPYIYFLLPLALLFSAYWNSIQHPTTIFLLAGIGILLGLSSLWKRVPSTSPLIIFSLLFGGLSLLSLNHSLASNLGHLEILLDLSVLTLFISLLISKSWHQLFLNTVMVLIGIQGIIAISQYLSRAEPRAAGTFLNPEVTSEYFPNALGLFFAMSIPLLWISNGKKLSKAQIGISCLGVLGLLLTFSRGALISFLIPTLLLLVVLVFSKHLHKALTILLSIIVAAAAFWGLHGVRTQSELATNDIQAKTTFAGTERSTSVSERAEFISQSLVMIGQQPPLGYGPDTFSEVYPRFQPSLLATSSHPHNWLLKVGVERGLVTLLALLCFLLGTCWMVFKGYKEAPVEKKILICTIFASLLAAALHNSIDFNLNFGINMLMLFTIIALFLQQAPLPEAKRGPHVIMAAAVLLLGWFLMQVYPLQSTLEQARAVPEETPTETIQLLESLPQPYQDSHTWLAELYNSFNQVEPAITALNTFHAVNQLDASSHSQLGWLYRAQEQPEEAADSFQKALKNDPNNFLSYYVNYYQTLDLLGEKELITEKVPHIQQLLENYLELAMQNIHFTAQKRNIQESIILADMFAHITPEELREPFAKLAEELHSVAMSQLDETEKCPLEAITSRECDLQLPD